MRGPFDTHNERDKGDIAQSLHISLLQHLDSSRENADGGQCQRCCERERKGVKEEKGGGGISTVIGQSGPLLPFSSSLFSLLDILLPSLSLPKTIFLLSKTISSFHSPRFLLLRTLWLPSSSSLLPPPLSPYFSPSSFFFIPLILPLFLPLP